MPQHLVSQLTGLSCTEENEFGLNNTSTYLASWTLGLRAALPHTGAYDNCLPSAPPVHVSPSTFPRLPSSSPILPPSVPLLSQDPERIAGPPAHAQLLPAGPRVGSSSSEPGIGPNGFSALSPCRPLATAWGRGLWLWKCKVRGYRERGEAAAGGRSACHSPPGRQSACVQLDCSGQTPLPAPPAPAPRPQLSRARCAPAASWPSRAPLSPRLASASPLPPASPPLPGFLSLAADPSPPLGGLCPGRAGSAHPDGAGGLGWGWGWPPSGAAARVPHPALPAPRPRGCLPLPFPIPEVQISGVGAAPQAESPRL
ncbi:uncharacterized protein [Vicugna pacos]|uniref:Uncharacterized protein isoform X1 n=1 Tax=Vicugna pacos TaxID=30538 RepID=A0ABM5CY51_VICPA